MKTIYLSLLFAIISNINVNGQKYLALDDDDAHNFISEYRYVNNDMVLNDKYEGLSFGLENKFTYLNAPDDTLISKRTLRKIRRHGIGFNAFGPTLLMGSIYYNVFIINSISIELGTDVRAYYCGFNYYPFNNKEWQVTPYIGAFVNYTTNIYLYEIADAPEKGFKGYFPIGLQIFTQNGFIFSPEIAVSIPEHKELNNIYWGVKLGYQFRNK